MRGKAIRMAWHVGPGDLVMKNFEEPWALHEPVGSILTSRIEAEKASLKSRLDELDRRFAPLAKEVPERRSFLSIKIPKTSICRSQPNWNVPGFEIRLMSPIQLRYERWSPAATI
jgi:hypothetical protein